MLKFTVMTDSPILIDFCWMSIDGGMVYRQEFGSLNGAIDELNHFKDKWPTDLKTWIEIKTPDGNFKMDHIV